MKAGVEIIAEAAVQINPDSFFTINLTCNHQLLTNFVGEDKYGFSGLVLRGKRVAASGRLQKYNIRGSLLGLGSWEAEKAQTVVVPALLSSRIRLILSTDLAADRDSFSALFGLKFIIGNDKTVFEVPFSSPVLDVNEFKPGNYSVELTELLQERAEKITILCAGK